MNRFKGFLFAMVASMVGVLSSGVALAQDSGFASAVTGTIDTTKTDVTTIGLAILAVVVLLCAIGWVSSAIRK
jgi:hypothetical protein